MNSDDSLQHYIDIGAIEMVGIEEDGEFIFKMTPEAETVAPELWMAHKESVDELLIDLYNKGLVSVSYNENLEATFELTEEGLKVAESYGLFEFPDDQQ